MITDEGDDGDDYEGDDESDDNRSDGYKSISSRQFSYHDYDEDLYDIKPKKKEVYVPVFVPEKEKKKSRIPPFIFVVFV